VEREGPPGEGLYYPFLGPSRGTYCTHRVAVARFFGAETPQARPPIQNGGNVFGVSNLAPGDLISRGVLDSN
jgi:hypothetical protein